MHYFFILILILLFLFWEIFLIPFVFIWALFSPASQEIGAYWYALIPFSIFLIIIAPWYVWIPGIWFTLSYLKHKEDSSVKNPLIK
jgi:hypothetical protein